MRMNIEEQKTLDEINEKLERIDKKLDKLEEHIVTLKERYDVGYIIFIDDSVIFNFY